MDGGLNKLDHLGKIPEGFEDEAVSCLDIIKSDESIHRALGLIVDASIEQNIGIDTLIRFVGSSNKIHRVLSKEVDDLCNAVYHIVLCAGNEKDIPSIPEPFLQRVSTDILSYFIGANRSISLYDQIEDDVGEYRGLAGEDKKIDFRLFGSDVDRIEGINETPLNDALGALYMSDKFRDVLTSCFVELTATELRAQFKDKLVRQPERAEAYFEPYVRHLMESTEDAKSLNASWMNLFLDAMAHGVPVGAIFSTMKKIRPEIRLDDSISQDGKGPSFIKLVSDAEKRLNRRNLYSKKGTIIVVNPSALHVPSEYLILYQSLKESGDLDDALASDSVGILKLIHVAHGGIGEEDSNALLYTDKSKRIAARVGQQIHAAGLPIDEIDE